MRYVNKPSRDFGEVSRALYAHLPRDVECSTLPFVALLSLPNVLSVFVVHTLFSSEWRLYMS